ncbi:YesL family protein [Sediminibacillus halophilus]|uniref:Uncharacterized membrane protein YesL n=1 Tax=Sediminibacillus halophilus TaxID=482461 RepID=A0A1G9U793_9BACI|nr:YesL family protein [Sediminibacillus halophilus]SDM55839.1 Uncharacterized membrane protein YesL [Sediminibacillus halophilus]
MKDRFGTFLVETSDWIMRLVKTNFTWWIHILMGGIVFGFFPATLALFATVRRWTRGDFDFPVWSSFHHCYRKHFWKVNGLGMIYLLVGIFIFIDILLANKVPGVLAVIVYFFLSFLFLIYLLSFTYFFSVYVHFQLPFKEYLKQPFIIMLISFKQNVLILIGITLIGYFIYQMPGLIPFLSGVLPAYWIMNILMKQFNKLAVADS